MQSLPCLGGDSVWLTGQRNGLPQSDIDIAVSGVSDIEALRDQIDEIPTLYTVDLVDLDTCRNALLIEDILVQYYAMTDFVSGSPKEVLRAAFRAQLISDDVWMEMLQVRNLLTHDYDGVIVRTHCDTIVQVYIGVMEDFRQTVEALLSNQETLF